MCGKFTAQATWQQVVDFSRPLTGEGGGDDDSEDGEVYTYRVNGTLPAAGTMGAVGVAALIANGASFALLWAHRDGDANMRSAWICTRNDVIGNLAVLLAAAGVFGTGTGWPDIVVAVIMAGLVRTALHRNVRAGRIT